MEDCDHVRQVKLATDRSFLNPRNWSCSECGTTESVWACLLCSHVACGRSCEQHALKHYQLSRHPLAIEVNLRYTYCYLCDDYILNDNSNGDIRLSQSLLSQVATQVYQESCTRSGRILRPATTKLLRVENRVEEANSDRADKRYTALCHWRFLQLFRAFNKWREIVTHSKTTQDTPSLPPPAPAKRAAKRKRLLTPGMTGLRNLGNTCYMNSILQSLGHLSYFRESFRQLGSQSMVTHGQPSSSSSSSSSSSIPFNRQTTVECFEHVQSCPAKRQRLSRRGRRSSGAGLKGGAGGGCGGRGLRFGGEDEGEETTQLSQEVHSLMRVMWSGKWAVVTPHAVLNAVWRLVPSFRGYSQQDAQEFLCEALEQLQSELTLWPKVGGVSSILPSLFQGQLASQLPQVTYRGCGHSSRRVEPFCDLSLDFPQRYQDDVRRPQQKTQRLQTCSLEELLDKFTERELLEEEVFCCGECQGTERQSVEKRLTIARPPDVIRLHLKRFRWSGKVRHKISTHVVFPMTLDLHPYYTPPPDDDVAMTMDPSDLQYSLASVVEHHGPGLTSGHYTAYCWNTDAGSWVHCNDNRIKRCSVKEVCMVQAYILFYARQRGCSPLITIETRT